MKQQRTIIVIENGNVSVKTVHASTTLGAVVAANKEVSRDRRVS